MKWLPDYKRRHLDPLRINPRVEFPSIHTCSNMLGRKPVTSPIRELPRAPQMPDHSAWVGYEGGHTLHDWVTLQLEFTKVRAFCVHGPVCKCVPVSVHGSGFQSS